MMEPPADGASLIEASLDGACGLIEGLRGGFVVFLD